MEAIAVLVLIGVAAYFMLRHVTERGTNTVRAYLYLRAIHEGASVQEANQMSRADLMISSHHVPEVKEYVRIAYGGKQLPMIAEAKKLGLVLSRPENSVVSNERRASETTPATDWVQPFILYYVASEMQYAAEGTIPDTVRALAAGRTSATNQSILAALQNYLAFAYGRNRRPDDWPMVARAGRDFLQAELRTLDSAVAVKRFLRRDSEGDTSGVPFEEQFTAFTAKMRSDEEFGLRIRSMMLKDSVRELFAARHGMTFNAYLTGMAAHYDI